MCGQAKQGSARQRWKEKSRVQRTNQVATTTLNPLGHGRQSPSSIMMMASRLLDHLLTPLTANDFETPYNQLASTLLIAFKLLSMLIVNFILAGRAIVNFNFPSRLIVRLKLPSYAAYPGVYSQLPKAASNSLSEKHNCPRMYSTLCPQLDTSQKAPPKFQTAHTAKTLWHPRNSKTLHASRCPRVLCGTMWAEPPA